MVANKYYEIIADFYRSILFVTIRGVWDIETAKQYQKELKKIVAPWVQSGEPWYVIIDVSEYPPQNEDVRAIHRELVDFAKNNGLQKAANIVSNKTYRGHIKYLSEKSGLKNYAFFKNIDEAEQWISEKD